MNYFVLHFFSTLFFICHNFNFAASETPKTVTLNDGHDIPILGFGTWQISGKAAVTATKDAINAGYRHIDTAFIYRNEKEVGKAIKDLIQEGKITRKDLFITTKIWNSYHSRTRVLDGMKKSLANLGLNYVDLLLIHWPGEDNLGTWRGMEDVHALGMAKSIGVSNFNEKQIDEILANGNVKPAVNQVISHPYMQQNKLLEYCKTNGIQLESYSPLDHGNPLLFNDKVLEDIGYKYNKTVAQVAIKFQEQRNVVVIPKSSNTERIIENADIFDFQLSQDDLEKIAKLDRQR